MSENQGGAAPPKSRSFADILSSSSCDLPLCPPERYKGMPAVTFSDKDIQEFSQRYRFALVGKFMKGRPTMATLKKAFDQIGFAGTFTLGLLDNRHILITFVKEEDFQRCWLRKTWFIQGYAMRILKWTADFRPDVESPVVPVWIAFEGLPAHLQEKRPLFTIANLIGTPLKIDASTLAHNRPSVARICVELNVMKPLPKQVWINNGSLGGFSQPVIYEHIPPYCGICNKFGHLQTECNRNPRPQATSSQAISTKVASEPPKQTSQAQLAPPRKRWRPVKEPVTEHQSVEQEKSDTQQTDEPSIPSSQEIEIPENNSLGITLRDDQKLQAQRSNDTAPGHYSDGEEIQRLDLPRHVLLQSWKEDSRRLATKISNSVSDQDNFITVTHKKRRPRKDYSSQAPSVTTRLAAGSLKRVSFSHRFK
ncbi:uncharacterized protein LOC116025506 [Ipomoea triloba]|uniref:uncharacterized protein LOC116025506 n=1 Tax=Ipomoea triloba TaxID=35885 RepID=UPI00125DB3D7|nr:uncharacterized protein LOC116025506 [Ipomoea triloba]